VVVGNLGAVAIRDFLLPEMHARILGTESVWMPGVQRLLRLASAFQKRRS
jgi:hypothetical protein